MKTALNFIGFFLVVVCVSAHAANEGCMYDTQCKIDRICDQGRCVSPSSQGFESEDLSELKHTQWLPKFYCTPAGKLGPYMNPDARTGKPVYKGESIGITPMREIVPVALVTDPVHDGGIPSRPC